MKLWNPSRAQWWIIWGVYVVALLISVDWDFPGYLDQTATLVTFLVIGGALAVWRLQGNTSQP